MVATPRLFAVVVATSFAAGLNIYATVATLGLLARAGVVPLPGSLEILSSWTVIGAAVTLYLVEFVADKIPAIDLAWNALQTFVRVPVAALLAYGASTQLSLSEQLLTAALASAIALVAHGGKTAARIAVTPSPEPYSNMALSFGEDVLAVYMTWLGTSHPLVAMVIALVLIALIVVFIHSVVRAFRSVMRGGLRQVQLRSDSVRQ
jgi:hypothetical protein